MNSTYTVKEAAQVLGLTPSRVRQLTASGVIASTLTPGKYGPTRTITAEALEAYRASHGVNQRDAMVDWRVLARGTKIATSVQLAAKDAKIAQLTDLLTQAQSQLKGTKHHVAALQRKAAEREATIGKLVRTVAGLEAVADDSEALVKAQADHINTLKQMVEIFGRQITDTNAALGGIRDMLTNPTNRAELVSGLRKFFGTEATQ